MFEYMCVINEVRCNDVVYDIFSRTKVNDKVKVYSKACKSCLIFFEHQICVWAIQLHKLPHLMTKHSLSRERDGIDWYVINFCTSYIPTYIEIFRCLL